METWQFARNTFQSVTATSYKLMNIILSDHLTRLGASIGDADFVEMLARTTPVKAAWDAAYTAWLSSKGIYKGRTELWEAKLTDLSTLRIKQWDIAIQGVFLEGTGDYTMLLPNARGPFQKGAYDLRLAQVKSLQERLLAVTPAVPALTTLAATVGTYHTEMKTLRDTQQTAEQSVDNSAALLEIERLAAATMMYKNLGRLMEKFADTPVRVEDFYDMNYIRDGAAVPPEDAPTPVTPPVL
ncbi:MAG: hypothetical protein ABL994_09005 [Verrucomicrobiales bacterium]